MIGVNYLSALLKKSGHQVSTIFLKRYNQVLKKDAKSSPSPENCHMMVDSCGRDLILAYNTPIKTKELNLFLKLLNRLKPDLIGFTLTTVTLNTTAKITKIVKEEFKNIPVVWGGIESTIEPEKCLGYADIVCLGEGEEAILELANSLDSQSRNTNIRNLWFKKNNGEIVKNPLRPLIQDLDSLPITDFTYNSKYLIDDERLFQEENLLLALSEGYYETITSRGCPFLCSYCCNNQLKKLYPNQKRLRRLSVENVIKELRQVKEELNPYQIIFHDDIFTFNKQWINSFAKLYREHISLPFWCNIHPLYTKEDVLLTLKEAGLSGVTCGIQSGSNYIANEIFNRKVANQDIIQCAKILNQLNINYNFDLITNNPFETEKDCQETLNLLLKLPNPTLNNGVSKLSFFPGTKIKERLDNEKTKKPVNEHMYAFYNKLYLITQFKIPPRRFIKALSKNRFLKHYPYLLEIFFILPRFKDQLKNLGKRIIPKSLWLQIKGFLSR